VDHDQWQGDVLRDPTGRADVEIRRERTGVVLRGQAGPLKGEVDVSTDGPADSAAARAITMLLLVTAAFTAALLVAGVCWLAHVSGLPLALAVVGAFTVMFVTCTILVFRRASPPARTPSLHPVIIATRHERQNAQESRVATIEVARADLRARAERAEADLDVMRAEVARLRAAALDAAPAGDDAGGARPARRRSTRGTGA
jgi:hypothetical protein